MKLFYFSFISVLLLFELFLQL